MSEPMWCDVRQQYCRCHDYGKRCDDFGTDIRTIGTGVATTCIEHAYGSTFRLSFQIKVF
jgi:hypothetical protein